MGCNNGWHFFEYTEPGNVEHLEFYPSTHRVLRMRMKLEEQELHQLEIPLRYPRRTP